MTSLASPLSAPIAPITLSVAQAAAVSGICRSGLYTYMAAGDLPAVKCGRRTLIRATDLAAFLDRLPNYQPRKAR